mmetsp:Transcript_1179/g.958  ORF Transcript_1179/g.958 Transcript_1179/m.958 type:complete len:330 (-) Transcript_1179:133-1122(-)
MAAEADNKKVLRAWLKKEDVYHSDLEKLFLEKGITDPLENFKTMSEKEWDTLRNEAIVIRAKDLKDQKAKTRWEQKLKKVEKIWRKQSGIKSTSIKKKSAAASKNAASGNTADNEQSKKYEAAASLKDYMRKNQIFDKDLFEILVKNEVTNEEEIGTKITTKKQLSEIIREVRVLRTADIKETTARQRLDKTLTKFEKLVVAKNEKLKKTSLKSGDDEKQLKDWDQDKEKEAADKEGKDIKEWLQKENIWLTELYDGLIKNGVTSPYQIQCLEETEFDEIVRTVRVDRFSNVKDQSARNNIDKMLVKFEKLWRKESGIKKTSVTKNTYK